MASSSNAARNRSSALPDATCVTQGWMLQFDGAFAATSNTRSSRSRGIGSGRNPRTDRRSATIAAKSSARIFTCR
ncbi:hypothetical protein FHT01_000867 [Sphingomonas japonica]|uniref:Uncharacterized protein n=1 Tax=Sphingomonas japonica TaxID=511662 RepID=A0ABX0TYE1_9SPHN|nr:hypothetical protein [Sphingomonas japonica]NIJ23325.1 hypothetical protein [Sphingomonas japonica]